MLGNRPGLIHAAGCLVLFSALAAGARPVDAGAVVLVNSQAPDYEDFPSLLEPYLVHFGIPYSVRDVSKPRAFAGLEESALVIIGHRGLDSPRCFVTRENEAALVAAIRSGTGLVSFDGLLAALQGSDRKPIYSYPQEIFGLGYAKPVSASEIAIGHDGAHYITSRRPVPRTVRLKAPMLVAAIAPGNGVQVLARAGDAPLLVAAQAGAGRAALFSSYDWVRPEIKGKLYGLDDLVWRSFVWAARKPFVMRGMPRFLAFRVDDVSGFGIGSNQHLGWIDAANRHGLRPWLGVFVDDMREDAIATRRLAELTRKGLATAGLHARRWPSFFYLDEPLLKDELERNIAGKPWSAEKMAANWAEGEKFFSDNGIVKSKLALPHFYEFAPNNFEGLKRWGVEMVGTVLEPGRGYGTPVPKAGPYLSGEPPRSSSGRDPIFIADWLKTPGSPEFDGRFFNFVAEVRDVTGYEWAPSGVTVEEAIRRGVEESRREFDSLLPAVLFTHESDHIRHIQPEDWERILAGVTERLKTDAPVPVTLDFAAQYMRALHTSRLRRAWYDPVSREGRAEFEGASDIPTKFYVFAPGAEAPRELEALPVRGLAGVRWKEAVR